MGCRDAEGLGVVGGDGGGRWDFVRLDGDRLGDIDTVTLCDKPSVEFQIKKLHDLTYRATRRWVLD